MTLSYVRRVAWLALLAALMHVLLPAAHAMAGGKLADGALAGARTSGPATVPAAFCLSPGSPLESVLRSSALPGGVGPSASSDGNPAPSHDTTAAICPLCIAGAMAAVLPPAPEMTATSRILSCVLARRAVDVPTPGIVLLSFLSRGPPAHG
jgi:hypothetical protein